MRSGGRIVLAALLFAVATAVGAHEYPTSRCLVEVGGRAFVDTERLRLRDFELSDLTTEAEPLRRLLTDAENVRYMAFAHPSRAALEAQVTALVTRWATEREQRPRTSFAFAMRREDALIGYAHSDLDPEDPGAAMIGYLVTPSAAGNGYATEAARAMVAFALRHFDVARVNAYVHPGNAPSIRLLERLGMTPRMTDGAPRRIVRQTPGGPQDRLVYSLARSLP